MTGSSHPAASLFAIALLASCTSAAPMELTLDAYRTEVVADDGFTLSAIELHLHGAPRDEAPRAWMFYLVGSEPVSVMTSTSQFAGLVARGYRVVLLQPRGVAGDGTVDEEVFRRYETRERRVADQIAVLSAFVAPEAHRPVLLVGVSQGGVVAADVAASDGRVTHLVLMASGGGWTQEEELERLVEQTPGALGLASVEELRTRVERIRADPDADTLWAGHPYRMWSSYLWFRPSDGLASVTIPILALHGDADHATPVESARALRDALGPNLTYVEYPGLDHHFADAMGESRLIDVQTDAFTWMAENGLP